MVEKRIAVSNPTAFARDQWLHVPVPFDPGEMPAAGAPWAVEDRPTVWQPLGAPWPDGSARHAVALARVRVPASRDLDLAVRRLDAAPPPVEPWAPSRSVAILGAGFRMEMVCDAGKRQTRAGLVPRRVLEANAARLVTLHVARIPDTMLVFECVLAIYADQDLAEFDAAVYCSDPRSAAMTQPVDRLALHVTGPVPVVRYWNARGINLGKASGDARVSEIVLLEKTFIGDGQGQRWRGSLLFEPGRDLADFDLRRGTLAAEAQHPLMAVAQWRGSKSYGPFGAIPELPPWLRSDAGRGAMARRAAEFTRRMHEKRGDPWDAPNLGLMKVPGSTGDQQDFGVIKLWPVVATGVPAYLLEAELAALQEACRPTHFFEADGAPVEADRHPDWVVWSGRTHWNAEASSDRLGKPAPEPPCDFHGWWGKDNQHWSSLTLCGFHALTGSFGALREIENEIRLYLASQRMEPDKAGNGPDAPRAVGRTLLSAAWLWLCTGDTRVRDRMVDRVEKMLQHVWTGGPLQGKPVRPIGIDGPDGRILDGKTRAWMPWQEALAVVGLAAVHRVTASAPALDIARHVARSVCMHGFELRADGSAQVAKDIRWKDGDALSDDERRDTERKHVTWADGTDFALWALPCVILSCQWAREASDAAWLERAQEIVKRMEARRRPPGDAWFDRYGEWAAV